MIPTKGTKGWRALVVSLGKVRSHIFKNRDEAARSADKVALWVRGLNAPLNFPENRSQLLIELGISPPG